MTMLSRRDLSLRIAAFTALPLLEGKATCATVRGPKLLQIRKGSSAVSILGFGEAQDHSWFSPNVRAAFDASDELWLETVPPFMAAPLSEAAQHKIDDLRYTDGKTFFDWLTPDVRARAEQRIANLEIAQADIEHLRPWAAYYLIMGTYYRRHPQAETKYVDEFLAKRAVDKHKKINFELPSYEAFVERTAQLSPAVQSQYISWLLAFLDDQDKSLKELNPYDWVTGEGSKMTRSLQRMIAMPQLYDAMQTRRNDWWAHKIVELLSNGGQYFIGIGRLHIIGPASIPNRLRAMGVKVEEI